ncbi:MAG: hypothetical protein K2Y42_18140 [Hyphomicrobium sp.]|uniref:hypothetical protein n=1 Tax=Hyphomicrobium sp. TaxID=82 RepID=UPI0025BD2058|nr:hypothetical protein [Hyphomicrobium sp.]MBX9864663.1 hypothetical protein [Hyphomicrobium sp.]
MHRYVVSYDLRDDETIDAYDRIFAALQTAADWCRPLFSFWIIETPRTPTEVIAYLREVGAIDENDGIVVLEITNVGAYRRVIDADVAAWLNARIVEV